VFDDVEEVVVESSGGPDCEIHESGDPGGGHLQDDECCCGAQYD